MTRLLPSLARLAFGLGLVVTMVGRPATAQRSALREVRTGGSAGGGLMLGIPVGEFAQHVNVAGGFGGFVNLGLDRAGAMGIRLDGSFLIYDNLHDVAYLTGGYYAYPLDMNTSSYIVSLKAGPQLTAGTGPMRLYGFALGGVSYFATETSFGDGCGCGSYASTTEWDDVNLAWEAGGGIQVALGGRRGRPVLLDLGARYVRNGRMSYVPAQSLASGTLTPVVSDANLVILQLGVSVGLR